MHSLERLPQTSETLGINIKILESALTEIERGGDSYEVAAILNDLVDLILNTELTIQNANFLASNHNLLFASAHISSKAKFEKTVAKVKAVFANLFTQIANKTEKEENVGRFLTAKNRKGKNCFVDHDKTLLTDFFAESAHYKTLKILEAEELNRRIFVFRGDNDVDFSRIYPFASELITEELYRRIFVFRGGNDVDFFRIYTFASELITDVAVRLLEVINESSERTKKVRNSKPAKVFSNFCESCLRLTVYASEEKKMKADGWYDVTSPVNANYRTPGGNKIKCMNHAKNSCTFPYKLSSPRFLTHYVDYNGLMNRKIITGKKEDISRATIDFLSTLQLSLNNFSVIYNFVDEIRQDIEMLMAEIPLSRIQLFFCSGDVDIFEFYNQEIKILVRRTKYTTEGKCEVILF